MERTDEKQTSPNLSPSNFVVCFGSLDDSRESFRVKYPLSEILFLVVSSVVSGYESNRGIENFGHLKLDWLRCHFPFEHGIPHHETIGNVIGLVDKLAFEQAFTEWVNLEFGKAAHGPIHVDGKRIASSADRALQEKPLSAGGKYSEVIVNAFASGPCIVLGQANATESYNEQEGAKALVKRINLKGRTVTGDSNFCTKEILALIRAEGGHYAMALKKNNLNLYRHVEACFGDGSLPLESHVNSNRGHGREESRLHELMDFSGSDYIGDAGFKDLRKAMRVKRTRLETRKGKVSEEVSYYITSLDSTAEELGDLIRGHWSVENKLHWVLDTEFGEDDSRKRTGNQASNFSVIRKIVLNMVNQNRGKKSIKAVRMACALSDKERNNILGLP